MIVIAGVEEGTLYVMRGGKVKELHMKNIRDSHDKEGV